MKIFKIFSMTTFLLSITSYADELGLQIGVSVTTKNMSQIAATSVPYAVARAGIKESGDNGVEAFLETNDKKLYSLSRSIKIHLSDMETENHFGNWSLSSYPEHLMLAGEYLAAAPAIAAAHGENFVKPNDPLTIIKDYDASYFISSDSEKKQSVGCLENSPLRYGDINNESQNELILTLGKNFIVFSPQLHKVIFSAHYHMDDEIAAADEERINIVHIKPDDPQYLASSTIDVREKSTLYSSWRSFSKLYFGHFTSETSSDILIWRKLYDSRLNKDPIKGFAKKGELLVHYKLINGEYKKQTTDPAVIKGWLTAKQLTWKKGYPSKSECPGQEGQYIPEMHDPLLNDPDVLQ